MQGPIKDLILGKAARLGKSLKDAVLFRHESPWETFRKESNLGLESKINLRSPYTNLFYYVDLII